MKFLVITNHSFMLWQFRRELLAELLKWGEVIISTPFVGHEQDFLQMGCRCVETKLERRGKNPLQDLKLYRFYKKLLQDEKPDLVITYSIKPNIYAGLACKTAKIPYYVNVQGLGTAFQRKETALLVKVMYKFAISDAKTVFFENEANAAFFLKQGIIERSKVVILPGAGVNLDYFFYQPYVEGGAEVHFLFVGRIMKEKGIGELLDAFRILRQEFGNKVVLDIVGFFEANESIYKQMIDDLVRDGSACFHGFCEDTRPYYAMSHCVVLPSYHEGMSNVLLEAAASGRALITSNISGCREAVQDGTTGFLCKVKDTQDLYKCMRRFFLYDRSARELMGKKGRIWMKEKYDRRKVVEMTVNSFKIRDHQ